MTDQPATSAKSKRPATPAKSKQPVTPAKPKAAQTVRYFIVNPSGAVHEVTAEHARTRLQQVGWRQATKEEVQEYLNRSGNQRFDDPIAPPWTPEPTPIELEGLDFTVMNDL